MSNRNTLIAEVFRETNHQYAQTIKPMNQVFWICCYMIRSMFSERPPSPSLIPHLHMS